MQSAGPFQAFIKEPSTSRSQAALSESLRAVSNEQVPLISQIVQGLLQALISDDNSPDQKLLVLELSKELLGLVSYSYLVLYEAGIMPWIVGVTNFERQLPFEQRCIMLFPNIDAQPKGVWVMTCKKLMNLCNQITETMGTELLPNAPFQTQQFPSVFAVAAKNLTTKSTGNQITEKFKQQFVVQYSLRDKNKQTTVAPMIKAAKNWLNGLLDRSHWTVAKLPPPVKQLNQMLGLLDTGDNHIISLTTDVCRDLIAQPGIQEKTKVDTLNFVDSVFLLGDPQILSEVRQKIVPILIQDILPNRNQQISVTMNLKERQVRSLKLYANASLLFSKTTRVSTNRKIYEAMAEVLRKIDLPMNWQDNFLKNLQRRELINKAKAPLWIGSSSYEEALEAVILKRISGSESPRNFKQDQVEVISIPVPEMEVVYDVFNVFMGKNTVNKEPPPQLQLPLSKTSSIPQKQSDPYQSKGMTSMAGGIEESERSDVNRSDMSGKNYDDENKGLNGMVIFKDSVRYPKGSKGDKREILGESHSIDKKPPMRPNDTVQKPVFAFKTAEDLASNPNQTQILARIKSQTHINTNGWASNLQKTSAYTSSVHSTSKQRLFLTQKFFPRSKDKAQPMQRINFVPQTNFITPCCGPINEYEQPQLVTSKYYERPSSEKDLIRSKAQRLKSNGNLYDSRKVLLFKESMLKRGELLVPQIISAPVNARKKMYKTKELLVRNQVLEIGFIWQNPNTIIEPGTVKLDLYYCPNKDLIDFEVDILSDCVTCCFDRIKQSTLPAGVQIKQTVQMSAPEPSQSFFFTRPTLEVCYELQNREAVLSLELPYTMLRMVQYQPVPDTQAFLNNFVSGHLLYTKPVTYSTRLIPEPSALSSIIPFLTLLDPEEKYFQFCGAVIDSVDRPLTLRYGVYVLFKRCKKVELIVEVSKFGMIELWMLWDRQPPYRTMLKHFMSDLLSVVAHQS